MRRRTGVVERDGTSDEHRGHCCLAAGRQAGGDLSFGPDCIRSLTKWGMSDRLDLATQIVPNQSHNQHHHISSVLKHCSLFRLMTYVERFKGLTLKVDLKPLSNVILETIIGFL